MKKAVNKPHNHQSHRKQQNTVVLPSGRVLVLPKPNKTEPYRKGLF